MRSGIRLGVLFCAVAACGASPVGAADREDELKGLRDAIQGSRERVTAHEADERALLERLEEVDKRLRAIASERKTAGRDVDVARKRLAEIEPRLAAAEAALVATRSALAKRAVALYRGGELGSLRVLFASDSLPDLLTRASALRRLVRHDASLVDRFKAERDGLALLRAEASIAAESQAEATERLNRVVAELESEKRGKRELLERARSDRKTERRMLLELEQAAQALEETIRTLGNRSESTSSGVAGQGFAARKGKIDLPVDAAIVERFGRVVDPDFGTQTFRSGVDFGAALGTPVRIVAPGIVRFAGWFRGYGRIVIVDHGDEFHSISGHLDEITVQVDQRVVSGERLGTVGETGSLRGASLYFEIRQGGEPVDPAEWLVGAK
jgi:septal ring factor EnvC (AmiA/AmiB activator)